MHKIHLTAQQLEMANKIKLITGKRLQTCIFCVRYSRGNYSKALALCSGNDSQEDGRQRAA
jgi:hypothetical protein